jgi:hypothetical protein
MAKKLLLKIWDFGILLARFSGESTLIYFLIINPHTHEKARFNPSERLSKGLFNCSHSFYYRDDHFLLDLVW